MAVVAVRASDAGAPAPGSLPRADPGSLSTAAVIIVDTELRIIHAEGAALGRRDHVVQDWPGRPLSEVLPAGAMAEQSRNHGRHV